MLNHLERELVVQGKGYTATLSLQNQDGQCVVDQIIPASSWQQNWAGCAEIQELLSRNDALVRGQQCAHTLSYPAGGLVRGEPGAAEPERRPRA
eukprot:1138987-Pelagomonas_calceolata.AAC.2